MRGIRLIQGDCLEVMNDIPDKSIDMILCDLPYGTTACKWDTIIPFGPLWEQYNRVIKDNGAIVLTASQPFTSALIMSNPKIFKYNWTWNKKRVTGFLNAKKQPLKTIEDICVFYEKQCTYNPQMVEGELHGSWGGSKESINKREGYGDFKDRTEGYSSKWYYPKNLLVFTSERGLHPTQKPVPLFEYLIKTYTNECETVLDNCMGSGTTGIACKNTNRNFIGIELDETYFNIAKERIENHTKQLGIKG